jgi:tetratricopeptide (TPR) repeat protein
MPITQDNIVKPVDFIDKLYTYNDQYKSAINDFEKVFANFKASPGNGEFQTIYSNLEGTLKNIETGVSTITQELQQNTQLIDDSLKAINDSLAVERDINDKLRTTRNDIFSKEKGVDIMLTDSITMYKTQRITNITIIVGILLLLGLIFKV